MANVSVEKVLLELSGSLIRKRAALKSSDVLPFAAELGLDVSADEDILAVAAKVRNRLGRLLRNAPIDGEITYRSQSGTVWVNSHQDLFRLAVIEGIGLKRLETDGYPDHKTTKARLESNVLPQVAAHLQVLLRQGLTEPDTHVAEPSASSELPSAGAIGFGSLLRRVRQEVPTAFELLSDADGTPPAATMFRMESAFHPGVAPYISRDIDTALRDELNRLAATAIADRKPVIVTGSPASGRTRTLLEALRHSVFAQHPLHIPRSPGLFATYAKRAISGGHARLILLDSLDDYLAADRAFSFVPHLMELAQAGHFVVATSTTGPLRTGSENLGTASEAQLLPEDREWLASSTVVHLESGLSLAEAERAGLPVNTRLAESHTGVPTLLQRCASVRDGGASDQEASQLNALIEALLLGRLISAQPIPTPRLVELARAAYTHAWPTRRWPDEIGSDQLAQLSEPVGGRGSRCAIASETPEGWRLYEALLAPLLAERNSELAALASGELGAACLSAEDVDSIGSTFYAHGIEPAAITCWHAAAERGSETSRVNLAFRSGNNVAVAPRSEAAQKPVHPGSAALTPSQVVATWMLLTALEIRQAESSDRPVQPVLVGRSSELNRQLASTLRRAAHPDVAALLGFPTNELIAAEAVTARHLRPIEDSSTIIFVTDDDISEADFELLSTGRDKGIEVVLPGQEARFVPGPRRRTEPLVHWIQPSDLVGAPIDLLARLCHHDYVRRELGSISAGEGRIAVRAWNELPEDLQRANRSLVRFYFADSAQLGVELIEAGEAPSRLDADRMEDLARLEHERWCNERRRSGWTFGSERDENSKKHPSLVPWDDLDAEDHRRDLDAITRMPTLAFVLGLGFGDSAD